MGTKVKSYTGQNVFGAKTKVEATKEKRYFVAPINGTGNIGKLSVKPEGGKVGVIFICKPARHSQDEGYIARPHGKGYAPPGICRGHFTKILLASGWSSKKFGFMTKTQAKYF